jgi:hypothetical protein
MLSVGRAASSAQYALDNWTDSRLVTMLRGRASGRVQSAEMGSAHLIQKVNVSISSFPA